jgi:NADH-quinone oxidoreductase subunit M
MSNLLSVIIFLPLVGALSVFLLSDKTDEEKSNIRYLSLSTVLFTFVFSLILFFQYDPNVAGYQFVEERTWLDIFNYKMGVDGISVPLILLTTFIMIIAVVASWRVQERVRDYMAAFLILETFILGAFCSLDLVLFYLFFEASLIPMFLLIGVWGGKRRIYASFKFFLYTFLGSLFMLIAMIYMYLEAGTTDITVLTQHSFNSDSFEILGIHVQGGVQTLLWLGFFASFAVKMPMWPVHTWLPDAHVEAPTAGSIVLAAILLKLGGYGFLRYNLPMFPYASELMTTFVFVLSVIAIVYTSLVALVQEDIKKLVAYSSVAHMGFVTMGIFSGNIQGVDGAMFQMISHGFISGALFLCIGIVYDRTHTRRIADYGGIVKVMPVFSTIFLFFTMANVGLPGTSGFVGEFLTLLSVFQVNTTIAFIATSGVILSAGYALWLYKRVIFGEITHNNLLELPDVSKREFLLLVPLVLATLIFGLFPTLLSDVYTQTISALVDSQSIQQSVLIDDFILKSSRL